MNPVPAGYLVQNMALHIGGDEAGTMLQSIKPEGAFVNETRLSIGTVGFVGGESLNDKNFLRFLGVPINGPDYRRINSADDAMTLLPQFDGAFVGIYWDGEAEKLVIVSDCLGIQPIYWSREAGRVRIATATVAFGDQRDLAAWGSFIAMGHTLGERSLVSGVERMPPATVVAYDGVTGTLQQERYWDWPDSAECPDTNTLLARLRRDVAGYLDYSDGGELLLSGGFDSRLLLCLLDEAGVDAEALIVNHTDEHADADGRFATAIARKYGWHYKEYAPPGDFFSSEAYLDYVIASDAATPSLYLFIAQLLDGIESGAVWDGLVPGFAFMPLHQPRGGFDQYVAHQVHGFDSVQWQAARLLFGESVADEMHDGFQEDLRHEIGNLPDNGFGVSRFVITNRSRNRTSVNPAKVYASRAKSFIPGLSKEFLTLAAGIPFEERRNARLYLDIFNRMSTRALSVPFLTGGEFVASKPVDWRYCYNLARSALQAFVGRHPRGAIGPLGHLRPNVRPRSKFLSLVLMDDEVAGELRALNRLHPDDPRVPAAERLLFHWKAWEWLHRHQLKERLMVGDRRTSE